MSKRKTFLPLLALICVLSLTAGWLLDRSGLGALGVRSPEPQQALRISEAQNNNVLTLATAAGEASGWIEVENTGAEPVNLHGACLIRDQRFNKTFVFPDMTLPAGGKRQTKDLAIQGLDAVDQWSVGFLRDGVYKAYASSARLRQSPRLRTLLELPLLRGQVAISMVDALGRRTLWAAESEG